MTFDALQDCFTTRLPWMQRIAHMHFGHLNAEQRDEAVQNTLALAWKFFHRLFEQGRANPVILKSVLWFAVKQTKSKRTVQGRARSKDAMDYRERGRVRFEQSDLDGLIGRHTPVPDQVSFRVDVPAFFSTLKPRQQALAYDLASGMTTSEVAEKHGVTRGAISQFRARFKRWYDEFFSK